MKVTKKYESKVYQKAGNMNVAWGAGWIWKRKWREKYLPDENSTAGKWRCAWTCAITIVILPA
jgi:hypothetical protein